MVLLATGRIGEVHTHIEVLTPVSVMKWAAYVRNGVAYETGPHQSLPVLLMHDPPELCREYLEELPPYPALLCIGEVGVAWMQEGRGEWGRRRAHAWAG